MRLHFINNNIKLYENAFYYLNFLVSSSLGEFYVKNKTRNFLLFHSVQLINFRSVQLFHFTATAAAADVIATVFPFTSLSLSSHFFRSRPLVFISRNIHIHNELFIFFNDDDDASELLISLFSLSPETQLPFYNFNILSVRDVEK